MSGQCSPTLKRGPGYAKVLCTLADGDALDRFELIKWHRLRRTPKALPLRESPLQPCDGPLPQSFAFELTQGRKDCELEPTAGGPEVQAFLQRYKRNVQRLPILEHRQQML